MTVQQINLDGWQDYRGHSVATVMFMDSSRQALCPVRDQLNECGKGFISEPNYETSTYNLISCHNTRAIANIVKAKHRYILFGVRYEGMQAEYNSKYLICGYMRIDHSRDIRDRHVRQFMNGSFEEQPECMSLKQCHALHGEMRFFSPEKSFELTQEKIKEWGFKNKLTRQMRLVLEEEALNEILKYFEDKEDDNAEYIQTVNDFKAFLEEEE